jgi:hypothetical protein
MFTTHSLRFKFVQICLNQLLLLNLCSNSYSTTTGEGVAICAPMTSGPSGSAAGGRGRAAAGRQASSFQQLRSSPPSGDDSPLLQASSSFNRIRATVLSSKRRRRLMGDGGGWAGMVAALFCVGCEMWSVGAPERRVCLIGFANTR